MEALAENGLTHAAATELSARRGEPEWLQRRRQEAWEAYEAADWPDAHDEAWRRVKLNALKPESYHSFQPAGAAEKLPSRFTAALGGIARQQNSESAGGSLAAEWRQRGVIFTSLREAAREYPVLVERSLDQLVPPSSNKLAALHGAFWNDGIFLYVPREVTLTAPLASILHADAADLALFPRLLAVIEPGASATLFEEQTAARAAFAAPVVEAFVGAGAQFRYIQLQQWGGETQAFGARRALLGRDARLEWTTILLGGKQSREQLQVILDGEGSEASLRGAYLPGEGETIHLDTLQEHRAAHTRSELTFKGALRDAAKSVFYGLIRVDPGAQQTDAYQQNRNLMLSDRSEAVSLPILEIEADDVRCSHGATVSQIDAEQLFYSMCRGLPRAAAEEMLVEAFFQEILDAAPDPALRERVTAALGAKLRAGRN